MPARSRQRVPLAFGKGLDRETGIMVVDPARFEDLRNVTLHQGKARVRGGFTSAITLPGVDTIVAGHALKSERVGVVVGYNSSDETVHVYLVASDASSAQELGTWTHDQGGWGSTPPRIIMAESYGMVFMAHDEPKITSRAPTFFYDPFSISGGSLLNVLNADLDGEGDNPVRFRGVVRHLNYLFGWGFGSDSENRPELVRVSKTGEPHLWEPNSYFIIGDRRDPVLQCVPGGGELLAFKSTETYAVVGEGRHNFAEIEVDPLYGIVGSRLAVNLSGVVLGWSHEGPRVWTGPGPSEDLEQPLELDGWEPTDLVDEGATDDAFAHYIPGERVIAFVFGQRVYALTVRRPGTWRWSYWTLGFTPRTAFTLFGGASANAPTGRPEYSSCTPAGTYADLTWDNTDQDGDEIVEIWAKPAGGSWTLWTSTAVSSTSPQTQRVGGSGRGDDLTPGTAYDFALRYRRGTLYATEYESSDPSEWPSVSRGTCTTTIDPPTLDSCVWSRVDASTEQIELTITPAAGQEGQDIEIYRDDVLVHTATSPETDSQFTWADTGITGETDHVYHLITKGASEDSPASDDHTCYSGPASPPTLDWAVEVSPDWEARWQNGDATLATELWDDWDDVNNVVGTFPVTARGTAPAGDQQRVSDPDLDQIQNSAPVTITVGVRHKSTVDGVDDFSKFSTLTVEFTTQA